MIDLFHRSLHISVCAHTVCVAVETSPDVHDTIILDNNRPDPAAAYMAKLIPELCSQQATASPGKATKGDFVFSHQYKQSKENSIYTLSPFHIGNHLTAPILYKTIHKKSVMTLL